MKPDSEPRPTEGHRESSWLDRKWRPLGPSGVCYPDVCPSPPYDQGTPLCRKGTSSCHVQPRPSRHDVGGRAGEGGKGGSSRDAQRSNDEDVPSCHDDVHVWLSWRPGSDRGYHVTRVHSLMEQHKNNVELEVLCVILVTLCDLCDLGYSVLSV